MKKFVLLVFLCSFISFQPAQQSFAADKAELQNFVNSLGNKIIAIASNNKINSKKKKEQLANIINQNVDIEWITKFVLGRHYKAASIGQKNKFGDLYRQFVINSYVPKFIEYGGAKFTITDVVSDSNYDVVKCVVNLKGDAANINLDFRVRAGGADSKQKLLVFDFVAEGVSFIEAQRSEFNSVITNEGLDKFLIDLESKVKKLTNQG